MIEIYFYVRDIFSVPFFGACFYLVWDVGWDRMSIRARLLYPTIGYPLHAFFGGRHDDEDNNKDEDEDKEEDKEEDNGGGEGK